MYQIIFVWLLVFHIEGWFSRRLQQMQISLLTNDACARFWSEDIKNTNICGSATGTTSCDVRNGCGILSLNRRSVILHLGPVNWRGFDHTEISNVISKIIHKKDGQCDPRAIFDTRKLSVCIATNQHCSCRESVEQFPAILKKEAYRICFSRNKQNKLCLRIWYGPAYFESLSPNVIRT